MATLRLATPLKATVLQAIADACDAGSGPALIRFYTAPMPATVEAAVTTQKLLGTLTCSDPCATVNGATTILEFGAIAQDNSADANGTAAWARISTSALDAVVDVDVSLVGAGGTIQMNTTNIVAGGPISMSSFTILA